MKRKFSLLAVVMLAVALALVGVLRDVDTSKALIPLPVQPINPDKPMFDGRDVSAGGTQLGVVVAAYSEGWDGHGLRGPVDNQYGRGSYGSSDIEVDDGVPLGEFLTTTDTLCVSTGPTDYSSVATSVSVTTPYTFDSESTDLVAADREWLLPQVPPYPISARFETMIDTIWILGGAVPYTLDPALPLNIVTTSLPWFPGSTLVQVWTGGGPGKPTMTCSDSAGGDQLTTTDGNLTTPVAQTGNPELVGDSAGPCDTAGCADKQIHGFWATPSITGAGTVQVTKRVLNNGPFAGSFKDVWHAEAPDGVTAAWSTTVTMNGSPFTADGSGDEISFSEDSLAVGTPVEYVGSLTLTCDTAGDYVVAIKNAAYPKAGTVDNDLVTNVAMTAIRVKCPAAASEVDKQVITMTPRLSAVSGTSAGLNRALGSSIDGKDPIGTHVQLLVGDTATLTFSTLLRNQSHENADGLVWLVAEGPDLDGAGTYDITLNWDDTSVSAEYGSDPDAITPLTVDSKSCVSDGGMACPGLELTMNEPYGPQILVTADLDITCDSAGRFLVPVKAVDQPTAHGDSNISNNVFWSSVSVYCWASEGDKTASDDGIDDATGLFPAWHANVVTGAYGGDLRKSVPPYPATGIASDTTYVERYIDLRCWYYDEDGAADLSDPADRDYGWITPAESIADMPAGMDDDGDCLADASFAQPGHPVDEDDQPDLANCPAIVYNDGNAPFAQVQYDTAADMDCDGLVDGIEKAWGSNPRLADSDGDGASDFEEMFMLTNPVNPDTDGDGILDKPEDDYIAAAAGSAESGENANEDDNCPLVYNPDQANNDGQRRDNGDELPGSYASNPNTDKAGDACDNDDDNDSVNDVAEDETDPMNPDSDGDRCVDGVEYIMGSDPTSAGSKCPASLDQTAQTFFRGCHINIPDEAGFSPGYSGEQYVENDVDGDGIDCPTDTDSDNGTGTGTAAPAEIVDSVEAMGYRTAISRKDSDGDGCEDWKEIVDVNGDRSANILDVLFVAKRAFNLIPASNSDPVLDIDKNGSLNILDALTAAKNSSLVKPHSPCPSEG